MKKIAIIGTGHMGTALLEGLINSDINKSQIIITHPSQEHLNILTKKYGVTGTIDNAYATKQSDYIFIAVKPLIIKQVIIEIKEFIKEKIIFSLAATININSLESYSKNPNQKIIRLMPNIPVSINQGVIGYFTNKNINISDEKEAINFLSCLGKILKTKEEKELDIIALISACGPAIVSNFIELVADYGKNLGLSEVDSLASTLKTFEGTLKYLQSNNLTPTHLKESVATKGGITEEILNDLKENKFNKIFTDSINKGLQKIRASAS